MMGHPVFRFGFLLPDSGNAVQPCAVAVQKREAVPRSPRSTRRPAKLERILGRRGVLAAGSNGFVERAEVRCGDRVG
jgi:hypothetical protein